MEVKWIIHVVSCIKFLRKAKRKNTSKLEETVKANGNWPFLKGSESGRLLEIFAVSLQDKEEILVRNNPSSNQTKNKTLLICKWLTQFKA